MSQPPGKIKEVFMDKALIDLDDIRSSLSRSIGVLLVLADGLDGYTRSVLNANPPPSGKSDHQIPPIQENSKEAI